MSAKMKIEVWSDIVCPFCYIGKRRFERSIKSLPFSKELELEWKSYQLNPHQETSTTESYYDNLAKHKGIPSQQAQQLCSQVAEMAATEGLSYDFEKAIVANTFRAHELSHFAKLFNKQDEAEELLFRAHFMEGKNIDDVTVLSEIILALGLDAEEFKDNLQSHKFENTVRQDIYEAQQIGVRGVPFFVYDRKYAISGAQDVEAFRNTVTKAYEEWKDSKENSIQVLEGPSCGPDGCD
ncbi:DsbA family oxidoreductase [Sphingobacterium sp. LRF_L2]|uniref:DsbA family oxidoreductase n=1 Tax=Sphingobacterium sp. LRF_L2 TaxID=3369421 RepID=UPI003F647578